MDSIFPNMSEEQVTRLRKDDPVVIILQARSRQIAFDWFRDSFKKDNGLKDELKYGHAVLSSTSLLDQYLYTYGLMIQSQWEHVLTGSSMTDEPLRLIDYGCGQGLAGVMLLDNWGESFAPNVKEIILIEPSEVALVRSEAVYRKAFPNASIICYNLKFDDLKSELFEPSAFRTLHIFSNVLDVQGFDISNIFNATFCDGSHTIIAVSHDRNFDGGSKRITAIAHEIGKQKYSSWLTVNGSVVKTFQCGGGGKFPAISWAADLDIKH